VARRRRKVAARHARAGHWGSRPVPMFTSGKVAYEVGGNVDATCFGGIAALHRLVTKIGLVEQINDDLQLLKVHLPYHESDHVLNLAYNVACGGTRLEDIERLRQDTAYMNALGADLIPDPTTAGDFCRRFTEADVVALMEAINAVRPKLWSGRGAELLGPVAYLDTDGTIAATTGAHKAGMDISYKGIWGYAPLIVRWPTPGRCCIWSTGRATRPAMPARPSGLIRRSSWWSRTPSGCACAGIPTSR
jgi:hypothetical protein